MLMYKTTLLSAAVAAVFSASAAAQENTAAWPEPIHDNPVMSKFMLDRLEARDTKSGTSTYWEGQAWVGTDLNKLWLKSEGSVLKGKTEDAELEAFYSRAIAPFWDLQAGMRHDFSVNGQPARNWAAFGLKGLAPYLFDVDLTGYVGSNGRTAARVKTEYELLLTQRLVLSPELEANFYGKSDPERGLGTGLSNMDFGLRLRYEIRREFAPYVGVVWTRKFGETADFARAAGDPVGDTQLVAGVRVWW